MTTVHGHWLRLLAGTALRHQLRLRLQLQLRLQLRRSDAAACPVDALDLADSHVGIVFLLLLLLLLLLLGQLM